MTIAAKMFTLKQKGFLCFCKGYEDRPFIEISRETQASDEMEGEPWIEVFKSKPETKQKTEIEWSRINIKL